MSITKEFDGFIVPSVLRSVKEGTDGSDRAVWPKTALCYSYENGIGTVVILETPGVSWRILLLNRM